MSDEHKSKVARNAGRVAEWLASQGAAFEGPGISEDSLTSALGMAHDEITEALDYLENREEVVRFPRALATPPQVALKPGRGWPEVRDEILSRAASG